MIWIMMDTTTPVIPTETREGPLGYARGRLREVEESAKERRMIQSAVPMVTDSSTPLRSARNDVRLRFAPLGMTMQRASLRLRSRKQSRN
jgi:hypothetical protein